MANTTFLSTKNIPDHERLIFALDVPSSDDAVDLVTRLGDSVTFYKLGLELWMTGNYLKLVDWLIKQNKKVFVDLKFFDVPETVSRAVERLRDVGATFITVHPTSDDLLRAVVAAKGDLKVLVVTVLTSLTNSDMLDLGFQASIENIVLSRARRAIELKCDGVISSGLELTKLRAELGNQFLVVVPGIRPGENRVVDDQKRVVSVEDAFRNGADYIVVGRPIKNAPDPRSAALAIQQTIRTVFQHS